MGTYNKGILGAFSGTVGPVVGANWRGKDIMRSRPKRSNRQPTENQLLQRDKFKAVTRFLTPLKPVTSRYFGVNVGDKSRANLAMSYHMKEAVEHDGTEFVMLYSKVQVSKGVLLAPQALVMAAEAGAVLRFTWTDNSGQATAKPTDQLLAVVYEPLSNQFEIFFEAGSRADGEAVVNLPAYLSGSEVQCWIGIVSEDGKLYATSNYMGAVTVL